MNRPPLLLLFVFVAGLHAQDALPPSEPPYFRVRYEASDKPGELAMGVSYTIWIPPGVETLRGVIVHQHGCGEGACKAGKTAAFDLHWQALARKHGCALLGPSYEQPEKANCALWSEPRNGSEARFLLALGELAAKSGHPELSTIPWALWGHSGGAHWAGNMLMLHPQKIAAVWLRSGTPGLFDEQRTKQPPLDIPVPALAVPVMCNLGTREGVTVKDDRFAHVWPNMESFFKEFRGKDGLIGVAVDPGSSHDCGNSRYLAIPWFDACLTARLPAKSGESLKPMPAEGAWLAPLLGDAAVHAGKFDGEPKSAVWLPDERVAKAWREYTKDGNVSDTTPPPAPIHVKLADNVLTWEAHADLESGIASFIIERDGREIGRVPDKASGSFGRKVFQNIGYSDTPAQPLTAMRFTLPPGGHIQVSTMNSVGMKSTATAP